MLIVGLTGSIGMGKSTVAHMMRQCGVAVFDADAVVHDLYEGAAVAEIEAAFPGSVDDGRVNRQALSRHLAKDPRGFARLEAIVHPLVREAQARFLDQQKTNGAKLAVLEIPLLLESGGEKRVDAVIVVSASPETQARRVLDRPEMTREKLQQILSRQMPDAEKRARADFIVDTDQSLQATEKQIIDILRELEHRAAVNGDRDRARNSP